MTVNDKKTKENRTLIVKLATMACGMFAFGFLLVPLYDALCDLAGIGGKTDSTPAIVDSYSPDNSRTVTVEFVASVNEYAPWEFHPVLTSMEVHPGEFYDATYYARNLTDRALTGQAVPSVAPGLAAKYFRKTECFCFTSQKFAAEEVKDMPLRFIIDPDLPEHIDRLTLSYTFFVSPQVALTAE
jgi:cytochrome c oxidase assembly protein subunit 11